MEYADNKNRIIGYTGQERRRYKRIRKHFIAQFQAMDEGEKKNDASWEMVTLQNLGAGGALFNYDKRLQKGSLINMHINFPLLSNPIRSIAKVIRIQESDASPVFGIAAVFIEIAEEQKKIIRAAEEFYAKKPGHIEP